MVEKDEYNKLSKRFSKLEQHCISLEIAMQLNKEIFQKNNTFVNITEPSFDQLFELNNLKAKLQAKDITIENVKKDIDEIETINIDLEHRVTKLIAENEHLKQTYKQLYDSIKSSCVRVKEHAESLVNQLNQKKIKGKDIVDNNAKVSNATTIASGMYKLDPIVKQAYSLNPLDSESYSACNYAKLIQELLGYVRDTCPDIHKPSEKLVVVTPINKKKTVRFTESVISLSTSQKQLGSSQTKTKQATNNSVSTSTGLSRSTKSSRSKSTDNTKNDKILHISSSTKKKNKVENHSRIVKSSLNKTNCVVKPSGNANVQHSKLNTNSELMYILVIVDDYSWFTWVKFLASKDEAPDFIIKFLKMIQVILNTAIRNIRTDNGTKFVNQTLCSYYESDLGKLQAKADIGIFIGYTPKKKAYRIYNRRTRKIIETIHVDFDELTAMASEQLGSGPELQSMTPLTSSSGLVSNPIPQQPFVSPVPVADAPRVVDLADSPVSTSIYQDALSTSIPSSQEQQHSPIISQGFEESPKTPHFHDDPLHESLHEDSTSQGSSSNVRPIHTSFESLGRLTKDHPIANVIRDPSRSVSTKKQLHTDAMWCYFDALLTSVEPNKVMLIKLKWI
ncbi:retrovirus-related pol polyprotein from transposon TNT 1-94 [Tanacetum coccineum]